MNRRSWRALPGQPRWLAGLAVALVFAGVCVLLAQWQWHRKEVRDARNAAIVANYDRDPAPLRAALDGAGLAAAADWVPVQVAGHYDARATLLVRNRTNGGRNGYLVAVPFVLAEPVAGRTELWLVRGWVPAGRDARSSPLPQSPAEAPQAVVARLRTPERAGDRVAPQGQAYRLAASELATASGRAAGVALDAYGLVVSEAVPADGPGVAPVPLSRPEIDPGPHLAYTIQWYLFALAGVCVWGVLYRREEDGGDLGQNGPDGAGRGRRRTDPWTYTPGA